jgi:nitroreductase
MALRSDAQPDELLHDAGLQAYLDVVLKRRSIRKLTTGPITDGVIHSILEAGRWSPSSNNSQPARIVVIQERQHEFWGFLEKLFHFPRWLCERDTSRR